MGFQVIHALQVGRQNTDDQIPRLNRRGSEYIRHIGTAVQDDEIHQLRGGVDQLEHHGVFDFRVA